MENQKNNELAGHSEMLKGFKEFQEQQNRNIDSLRSISEKMNGIHAATHLEAMKNVSSALHAKRVNDLFKKELPKPLPNISTDLIQGILKSDIAQNKRRREVEDSMIEMSALLEVTNQNIQSLNHTQNLQIQQLEKLVELHLISHQGQKSNAIEGRIVNAIVIAVAVIGTIFTVISYFK